MCCNRIKKAEPRFALFSSRLQTVVLKDFVLFLKQESGSRVQGSKARGIKKAFSNVLHARSKVKEFLNFFSNSGNLVNLAKSILNSIYTTLQAETLILTCPPFPLFSCQSFRPRGSPLKADSHEGATCSRLSIRIRRPINGLIFIKTYYLLLLF